MKRTICILLCGAFCLQLCACTSISGSFKEIDSLLVIQTMGIDRGRTLTVSLASAANPRSQTAPKRLSSQAASISAALEKTFDNSADRHLFFSHIEQIVLGEKTAENGIEDYLNYICRSPLMRIDVPLFAVRNASAEDAILNSGDDTLGISEMLRGITTSGRSRGDICISTAADVLRETERSGSSLICALSLEESKDDSEKLSPTPDGSAVIRGFRLCKYLDREQTICANILKNSFDPCEIELRDSNGEITVISINESACTFSPEWSSPGKLSSIRIRAALGCSVLELKENGRTNSEDYYNRLTALLEEYMCEQIRLCLKSAKDLKADFIGIGAAVERSSPEYYKLIGSDFQSLLPSIEFNIGVSANLNHTNDMKEA